MSYYLEDSVPLLIVSVLSAFHNYYLMKNVTFYNKRLMFAIILMCVQLLLIVWKQRSFQFYTIFTAALFIYITVLFERGTIDKKWLEIWMKFLSFYNWILTVMFLYFTITNLFRSVSVKPIYNPILMQTVPHDIIIDKNIEKVHKFYRDQDTEFYNKQILERRQRIEELADRLTNETYLYSYLGHEYSTRINRLHYFLGPELSITDIRQRYFRLDHQVEFAAGANYNPQEKRQFELKFKETVKQMFIEVIKKLIQKAGFATKQSDLEEFSVDEIHQILERNRSVLHLPSLGMGWGTFVPLNNKQLKKKLFTAVLEAFQMKIRNLDETTRRRRELNRDDDRGRISGIDG